MSGSEEQVVTEEDDSAAKDIFDFDPDLLEHVVWEGSEELTDEQLLLTALQEIVADGELSSNAAVSAATSSATIAQCSMGYMPVQPSPVTASLSDGHSTHPSAISPPVYSANYSHYPSQMHIPAEHDVITLSGKSTTSARLDYSPPVAPQGVYDFQTPSYPMTPSEYYAASSQSSSQRSSINRKHKREDLLREFGQNSLLTSSAHSVSSTDTSQHDNIFGIEHIEHHRTTHDDDSDDEEGVKAMRYGSLGRIIASTITASSVHDRQQSTNTLPQKSQEETNDERKALVTKMMRCLHLCDMNGLAKIIRERCCEACLLITPDVVEPIAGRGDIMMMFSLLLEMFPDGLWTTQSITCNQFDTVSCQYKFQGTRVFHYPIDVLFRQIKSHIIRNPPHNSSVNAEDGVLSLSSEKLVNEVAEHVHMLPAESGRSINLSPSTSLLENSLHALNEERKSEDAIQIPRRTQSLREVKTIETAVLKEGPTTYKRKWDITFDEQNMIIRMVIMNV